MMENLKKVYRDLEMRVYSELRTLIENSDIICAEVNRKAIKVDDDTQYEYMTIIHDKLTFIVGGLHYHVVGHDLETLITIIEDNKSI